ncbi:nucleotidyltransferase family protein [Piscirickettsia salmonis]|uniref:nucleotidyltransferase family protein n=1 Tax=Piscirickettsia salmonis TaxID=1238 RepID=UPI000A45E0EA|nr:sugar phosphate nucleotidyltransferase [Piscirickettsia salmonis]
MTIKAMILAAGRGERMRPLTDTLPKPLLDVAGKCLIEYRIEALVQAGIRDIVINASYQAERLIEVIGDGQRYGASIEYSVEEERLETGGELLKRCPYYQTVLSSLIVIFGLILIFLIYCSVRTHLILIRPCKRY